MTFSAMALLTAVLSAGSYQPADYGILTTRDDIVAFVGSPSFADAFHCGDKIELKNTDCRLGCGADGCSQVCMGSSNSTQEVVECTADAIKVEAGASDYAISKDEHDSIGGNWPLYFAENFGDVIGLPGTEVIVSAVPFNYAYANGTTVSALKINGSLKTSGGQTLSYYVTAGKGVNGLAQILDLGVFDKSWSRVQSTNR